VVLTSGRRQLRRREAGWEGQLMQVEVEWRDRSPMLRHLRHPGRPTFKVIRLAWSLLRPRLFTQQFCAPESSFYL
jgi:hypothetical protein